jgi:DNA helicase HerA-like ATPase
MTTPLDDLIELGIVLDIEQGDCFVKAEDLFQHALIIGQTGAGKTNYLKYLASKIQGACIILDPHGDFASYTNPDILIDKNNPISLNPIDRDLDYSTRANELSEIINSAVSHLTFEQQMPITVLMRKILLNALRIGFRDFEKLGDFLEYDDQRKKMADNFWKHFDDKDAKGWYIYKEQVESARRINTRLSLYYEDQNLLPFIKGKCEFSVQEIAEKGLRVAFDLSGFDDEARAFLGTIITNLIKSYYLHKDEAGGPPLFVFVDEFHLFINNLFARLLAEGRKYSLGFIFSGHSLGQVDFEQAKLFMANTLVKIVLNCGIEDAEVFSHWLQVPRKNIINLEPYEAYIAIGKKPHHALTFPAPKTEPKINLSFDFLKDGWFPVKSQM